MVIFFKSILIEVLQIETQFDNEQNITNWQCHIFTRTEIVNYEI